MSESPSCLNSQSQGSAIFDVSELPDKVSAKFLSFLTLYPLVRIWIYTIKFTQPPLLRPLFHDPFPPPIRTSYLEAPQNKVVLVSI